MYRNVQKLYQNRPPSCIEARPRNDLLCVERDIKLYSFTHSCIEVEPAELACSVCTEIGLYWRHLLWYPKVVMSEVVIWSYPVLSWLICKCYVSSSWFAGLLTLQGAANKSNPLPCFVSISTTNLNFYKKIYAAVSHSYLHITAKLCHIITIFD